MGARRATGGPGNKHANQAALTSGSLELALKSIYYSCGNKLHQAASGSVLRAPMNHYVVNQSSDAGQPSGECFASQLIRLT